MVPVICLEIFYIRKSAFCHFDHNFRPKCPEYRGVEGLTNRGGDNYFGLGCTFSVLVSKGGTDNGEKCK